MFTCYKICTKYSLVLHRYSNLFLEPYNYLKHNKLFHLCGVFRINSRGEKQCCAGRERLTFCLVKACVKEPNMLVVGKNIYDVICFTKHCFRLFQNSFWIHYHPISLWPGKFAVDDYYLLFLLLILLCPCAVQICTYCPMHSSSC